MNKTITVTYTDTEELLKFFAKQERIANELEGKLKVTVE